MNEDKLKGKNHSFSIFSQLQELYGKEFNTGWEKRLKRGVNYTENSNRIKWKESNHAT